jgi:uncharacterized membrane protein (UPF0182 family)
VPIGESLLYVQPLYIIADQNPVPLLRKVIVEFDGQVGYGDTLREALLQIFDEVPETLEEGEGGPPPVDGEEPTEPEQDPGVLLDRAEQLFVEAEAALEAGGVAGFAEYAEKVAEARDLIEQARDLLGGGDTGAADPGAPTTTSTTAPATTTTSEPDSA